MCEVLLLTLIELILSLCMQLHHSLIRMCLRPSLDRPRCLHFSQQGYDEEIGGSRSAKYLAELLHSRYGPNGVALILDEGFTGVDTAFNTTFARFGMAEKGAVNLDLTVLTPCVVKLT